MKTPFFPGLAQATLGRARRTVQEQIRANARAFEKSKLLEFSGLFSPWVPEELLQSTESGAHSRKRVYSLNNTFWSFLYQVFLPGISCREVVKKIQACSIARKKEFPGSGTSAYCQARRRLPLDKLRSIYRETVRSVERRTCAIPQWQGRRVKVVDATGLSMPDIPELQEAWPQQGCQKPGCGFPMMKLVGLFDLASGVLIDWVQASKYHHESGLFRKLWDHLKTGDVLLADRAYCAYGTMAALRVQGVDVVFRLHQKRRSDFRQGKRLGRNDRLVNWSRPRAPTKGWNADDWQKLPAHLSLRMLRYTVQEPGFRTRQIELITTLLDPSVFPLCELAKLYFRRWSVELFYRDIKISMGMDVLRTRSVPMIQREVIMHAIAYNLTRAVMADAAIRYDTALDRISFKGTLDQIRQWNSLALSARTTTSRCTSLRNNFLALLVEILNPKRSGRVEPRARKRRPKNYILMNRPRREMYVPPHREKAPK